MPVEVKESFEREFARDFSDVRIYNSQASTELTAGMNARAFTYGNNIVFNRREYQPDSETGRQLLRHELVHVVQQRNANTQVVQRAPIARENYPIPEFEFKEGKQVQTSESTGNHVDLSYDPDTSVFTCTFTLYWKFDSAYNEEAQRTYKAAFIQAVKDAWEGKFEIVEYDLDEKATGRKAKVALAFQETSAQIPEFVDTEEANAMTQETRWLADPANRAVLDEILTSTRVDVSADYIREHVVGKDIRLDPRSSLEESKDVSRYENYGRPEVITDIAAYENPPYGEYEKQNVPLQVQRGLKTTRQTTTAHEFGHSIGLADEYALDRGDYDKLAQARGKEQADAALRQRNEVTDRMMNIGSRVTRDQYRPFAVWLSELTGKRWIVSGERI